MSRVVWGSFLAIVFDTGAKWITKDRAPYRVLCRYILLLIAGACLGWLLAGFMALGTEGLLPRSIVQNDSFSGHTSEYLMRRAWVSGAVWGAPLGGVMALVFALILLARRWQRVTMSPASTRPRADSNSCSRSP